MDSSKVLPCRLSAPFPEVGAAGPVEDVIQLSQDVERLLGRGRLGTVNRDVARLADELGFLPDDLGHEFAEGKVADEAVQVRDLRRLQRLLDSCRHA